MIRVLLAGEQVTATTVEIKGFDHFGVNTYKEDGQYLVNALEKNNIKVDWMKTFQVQTDFPETMEQLQPYNVIILSDVGANSLLFHPDVLTKCMRRPNRLELLKNYVLQGGGLAMVGGWMSFSGIDARAKYYHSPLESVLPVNCLTYDDREEKPEGVTPLLKDAKHEIFNKVSGNWPFFLGYNRVLPKAEATTLLQFENADPLLSVMETGKGRTAAFTSDCAPHWGPKDFLEWQGYPVFWSNLVKWLAKESTK